MSLTTAQSKTGRRQLLLTAGLLLSWAATAGLPAGQEGGAMSLVLTSSSFAEGGEIPKRHTCQGQDVSPPLAWTGAPEGARSFALIVDDPDAPDPRAPRMTWVHWVLYFSSMTEPPLNHPGEPHRTAAARPSLPQRS